MGADRAIHVEVAAPEYETLQPLHISKMLAKLAKDENIDVVIVGKQVKFIDRFYTILIAYSSYFLNRQLMMTVIRQLK